jgi:hypothetical protein
VFVLLPFFFLLAEESSVVKSDANVINREKESIDDYLERVNCLIQRGHLFDHFIDDSDWVSYSELVHDKSLHDEGGIGLIVGAYYLEPLPPDSPQEALELEKDLIPYAVLFGSQILLKNDKLNNEEIFPTPFTQFSFEMAFRNNEKRELAGISERTPVFHTEMLFDKNTNPQKFWLWFYSKKLNHYDYDNTAQIYWDKNKKITSHEKLELTQKLPPVIIKLSKSPPKQRQLPTINLTAIKDKKILKTLLNAEKICSFKNLYEFISNAKSFSLFGKDEHPSIMIWFLNGELRHIIICSNDTVEKEYSDIHRCFGYYLSFKNNKLRIYAEGDLPLSLLGYQNATFKDKIKRDDLSIDGNGIEVKFYPNGFPESCRNIIRNRLFGRQIEWNDKGEVVSDVDLDIPKEWKNAPKRNESQPK